MCIIHTADWQIGKPCSTVADEQKRFRLQQERTAAVGRIRDVVRLQDAQLQLVAGDLFDLPTPDTTDVLEVLKLIGGMEVPVLVIPGNRYHGAPGTVWHRDDFQRYQRQPLGACRTFHRGPATVLEPRIPKSPIAAAAN